MKTLLKNSKVWLGKNKFADSVGFDSDSGKIIFLGTSGHANLEKNKYDEVIDTEKKLIIPAFTEGHCHFIKGSLVNSQLNLRNAKTINDFIKGIRNYKQKKNNAWIQGGYFSESNFSEKILPDKNFLDKICDDIPLIISRFDMHSAFANTKALELSGIVSREDDFNEEELIKNKDGFTGELKERARDFVLNNIPPPSLNERTEIALSQLSNFHSFGIVAISDITLPEDIEVYRELINRKQLNLRIDARLPFTEFKNIPDYRKEFSSLSDLIKFDSLKAFYDGSLSSRTALMHGGYKNTTDKGIVTEFVRSGDFQRMAFEIDKSGMQMSVHAIGDKAVTELLDLIAELTQKNGLRDRRFRIEHAQHIHENDFERFKELNVIASVQPGHLFSDAKTAAEILPDRTIEHNYKKLFDIDAKVCFGTDFPVVSENPFETIHYAMTRKVEAFEEAFVPENSISLESCLEAYTINNAYATFEENNRGSLQVGKFADLAVIEDDLFQMNSTEVRNTKVNMTYFNGRRVY